MAGAVARLADLLPAGVKRRMHIRTLRDAYVFLFRGEHEAAWAARKVLNDIIGFSQMRDHTVVVDGAGRYDDHMAAHMAGKRIMGEHIVRLLAMRDEDIIDIVKVYEKEHRDGEEIDDED